ncbi:hypothetical protein N7493_000621 [Penicillium malachiteum]|uniref:Alpha-carbonic anhydrase domain-containing protein n=1 Tax=Penicillium malachiteum TaxID=1324776 RepID=A0AAD6HWN1_9EURO|nr:hypothetical protein N7493_000621 [Penicillium malachiteum]
MNTRFTGDTKNPAVNVTNWVLLSTVILGVLARLGTKLRLFKRLTLDDCFIIASLVGAHLLYNFSGYRAFCAIQSICVSMAVDAGYGNHFTELSTDQFDTVMKISTQYLYASTMVYIASHCFSKLSLVIFIRSLTPSSKDHFFALLIGIVTGVWAVASIFGYAFQCSVPNTWDFWNGKCFNIEAWRYFVCISNIVTDFLILAQGFLLLYRVQAAVTKRLLIASLFLPRLLVIGAVLAELIFTHKAVNTTDPTYAYCDVTILQETSQCLGIITACWGQLKPFLSWLKSSGLRIQDFDYTNYANAYGRSNIQSQTQSRPRTGRGELNLGTFPLQKKTQILVTRDWEVDSQSSQADIIQEPHTWAESTSARQSPVN